MRTIGIGKSRIIQLNTSLCRKRKSIIAGVFKNRPVTDIKYKSTFRLSVCLWPTFRTEDKCGQMSTEQKTIVHRGSGRRVYFCGFEDVFTDQPPPCIPHGHPPGKWHKVYKTSLWRWHQLLLIYVKWLKQRLRSRLITPITPTVTLLAEEQPHWNN